MFLLVAASREDERFQQLVDEIGELETGSRDPKDLVIRIQDSRYRWTHPNDDADRLWQILQAAPLDDEPLTEEEIAMLDHARASVASGATISHDELGRLLDEA